MKYKKNILILALAVFLMGVGLPAVSMAVSASAECAYRNDGDPPAGIPADLECHIYINTGIPADPGLISGGVKLLYDKSKLETPTLTIAGMGTPGAINADWYFGDAAPGINCPNCLEIIESTNPDDGVPGEAIFIVGKMDSSVNPQVGVNGTRVKVGTAKFTRKTNEILAGKQETFFGINLDLGRTTGSFVNFVDITSAELDNTVTLNSPAVVERGDANADGFITNSDFFQIRNDIIGDVYRVYTDCNYDGFVTNSDFFCVKNKL